MSSQRYPHIIKALFFTVAGIVVSVAAVAGTIADTPLFLSQSTKPQVMFTMSNDHQLFYKAYDDYSDIDDDGTADTTYKHSVDYYGYFDSYKCYDYDATDSRFEPSSITADKYCTATTTDWSGNFLNWATMARMDTIRKILYGGYRSTDTAALTVLERTFLPNDAHSFAKYYNGANLDDLTPSESLSVTEITICNTTVNNSSAYSQNVTDAPLLRVAKGDYSLWASNERWQCRWSGEKSASNANVQASSGLSAASSNPTKGATTGWDFTARVEACNSSLIGKEKCKRYPDGNYKPIGLLQEYGDEDEIEYGLMTGSYAKNKSGGTLRKNIGSMSDEINISTDGTFKSAPASGNIVGTIDKLRLFGYYYGSGVYNNSSPGDNCSWGLSSFSDGRCSNWGNPQAEIFLEALRYFAGQSATTAFDATDSGKISGLVKATWSDPLSDANWCAPLNIINFNASTISYDGDQLSGTSDIGAGSAGTLTDAIGISESIHGNNYFIGENGVDNNQLCTAKTVTSLGDVQGTCPDAPRLDGTYHIAGLASYARTNTIRTDLMTNEQTVMTYGVALSPATPQLDIPTPDGSKNVVILPACRNNSVGGNCAIVDFKIVDAYSSDGTKATGKVYVNWEDSEQGGDYDQDMWGVLSYEITNTTVKVTTDTIADSTGYQMGFGYVIGGTTQDGFHAHSGIRSYDYSDPYAGVIGCSNCYIADAATSETYILGSSTATLLEQPLYYAAKYGGFIDPTNNENNTLDLADDSEWDSNSDGTPDKYFYATNPAELATSLSNAFASVAAEKSSSASIVADSVTLETGTHIYQAQFDSGEWSGTIKAFPLDSVGAVGTAKWDSGTQVNAQNYDSARVILSHDGSNGVAFRWANLSSTQQALMNIDPVTSATDTLGDERLNYLRGDTSNELQYGAGSFRDRDHRLGDIISSTPYYVGEPRFIYGDDYIDSADSTTFYSTFKATIKALNSGAGRTRMLYSGANDGMLHGFDADTGNEKIAYVPNHLIGELPKLANINYSHQYFVDGSPTSGDAYEAFPGCNSGSCWRSVLVGGLAAGGKAMFALDVTDPSDFSETDPLNHVLWEIDDTTTGFGDLGYTFGQPAIVRTSSGASADGGKGAWAAIFPNGYNSGTGEAVLYIVNIRTGALIASIDVGTTGTNGLSTAAPVDIDGDQVIDYVYAGDLQGNMWKFDLTNKNAGQWDVAFKQGSIPEPLFTTNTDQPITSQPEIGKHPSEGGYMIYFGTGQYYETGDNDPTGATLQTFYAIWDKDDGDAQSHELVKTDLQEQTIIYEAVETFGSYSSEIRLTSQNAVNWSNDYGWYLDLAFDTDDSGTIDTNEILGERVVNSPLLHGGRIIFTTLIPSTHACDYGGTGWLMELSSGEGGRLEVSPFDLNNDGGFTEDDYVLYDIDGDGVKDKVPVSGKKSKVGIIQKPTIVSAGNKEYKYSSGSKNAEIEMTTESTDAAGTGRTSWRQLK